MSKRKDKSSSGPSPSSSMTTRSRMSVDRKVQYRNFLEGFSKLELEGASMDEKMEYTTNVIKEADELLQQGSMEDRVKNPTESFLASRVLRAASQMAATCAAGVSGAVHVYDRRELAAHIKEKPEFWNVLFPLEAPVTCSLFGAFDAAPEERPRAERRRVERQALAEKKAPANVDKMDKTEEGAEMVARVKRFVTKTFQRTGAPLSYFHTVLDPGSFARSVENVYHLSFLVREGAVSCHVGKTFQRTGAPLSYFHTVLDPGSFARSVENVYHLSFLVREGAVSCHVGKTFQRTGAPLSYFHTVLDPGSFARSVENVYHLSFLVREGAVSCHVDEEHGLPFIAPVTEEARGGGLAKEHQFIVSLDMQRWQDLIKAFNIDQPMMVLKR
ncbi:uncharacterized protein LOC134676271 [Cydia fagiglandana]|uniref:uncharacterized protein LOC134676271 n=1 Tax=Cydia fagiglandana TaxID=1458189 RepID=UPI002FEE64B1